MRERKKSILTSQQKLWCNSMRNWDLCETGSKKIQRCNLNTTAVARNRLYFLWYLSWTKRSSTYFLECRSPITWYRQVQRQIAWCQEENRFFTIIYTKHSIFWRTCCSFLKTLKIWYLRLPRRGQDFWNLACFAWSPIVAPWSAHDQPMIALWLSTTKWKQMCTCKRFSIF